MTRNNIAFAMACAALCAGLYFVMPFSPAQKCRGPVAELFLPCIK